jgi:hypothetical protein
MNRWGSVALGAVLLVALDTLVVVFARALDPGAPVLYISNLAAVFIGAIQLVYGVPLLLWQRKKRPHLAAGIAAGMVFVLTLNVIALYR